MSLPTQPAGRPARLVFLSSRHRPWTWLQRVGATATAATAAALSSLALFAVPAWAADDSVGSASERARPRIWREVRNDQRIKLRGSSHPRARTEDDRGAVDDALDLDQMVLVLKPSAAQEQALEALQLAQQDPASPEYRQWLSPQQFAQRFGVAQADIDAITDWLTQQGFRVDDVTPSQRSIVFSGNARQVRESFGVKLRYYERRGKRHIAHADAVQLPAALSEVVAGIASLHNFRSEPLHRARALGIQATAEAETEAVTARATPQATDGNANYLAAGDFHTIYNLKSVLSQGLTGAGRSIAVIGRSDILLSNVATFRNSMALPSNLPQVINGGAAPGFVTGDELESDLDVQWAGAVAIGATVQFVTTASTATSDGIGLSALYAVNNNIGDVITVSYGLCESLLGTGGTNFYNSLWQQATVQGQTVVVSSGDSGAAGCDPATATTATRGQGVNGLCTSPYSTCVGGTQFDDTGSPTTWWSSSNDAGGASALSYIPEVAWNESGSNGGTGLLSSGGGSSISYGKPSWQSTAGVPADNSRHVPDVSLNASSRVGYLVTSSDNATRSPTTYVVGGTSASAPALAGILAMVGQKTGYRLGNINPTLYGLANRQAITGKAYYHLITSGNNSVPGQTGFSASAATPRYNLVTGLGTIDGAVFVNGYTDTLATSSTALSSSASRITAGQSLTLSATVSGSGATGTMQFTDNGANLGAPVALSAGTAVLSTTSLAVGSHSLVAVYSGNPSRQPSTSAPITVTVLVASTTSLSASPPTITVGQPVTLTASVAGNTPTGTVQFMDGSTPLGAPAVLSNGLASLSTNQLGPAGTRSVSAVYAGDAIHAPSTSPVATVTVNASPSSITLSASPSRAVFGQAVTLSATVSGYQPGGSVQFFDGSASIGNATLRQGTATLTLSNLNTGARALSARYAGDGNNLASVSMSVNATIDATERPQDGDVPTLPEWAAIVLAALLGWQTWRKREAQGR
jgi:pseudomonalisin